MDVLVVAGSVLAGLTLVGALPLGLSICAPDANSRAWRRVWPVVGGVGALSIALPAGGGLATGAALFYAAAAAALALSATLRLLRPRPWPATETAVIGALVSPLAGAGLLVAERATALAPTALWGVALATAGAGLGLVGAGGAVGTGGRAARRAAIGAALLAWVPGVAAGVLVAVAPAGGPSLWVGLPATVLALFAGAVLVRRSRSASGSTGERCAAQTPAHDVRHGV